MIHHGLNDGQVQITSTNDALIVVSERVIYTPDSGATQTGVSELVSLLAGRLTGSNTGTFYPRLT